MINIEYKKNPEGFPKFFDYISEKNVLVIGDVNTYPYVEGIYDQIKEHAKKTKQFIFSDKQLIPDERAIAAILSQTEEMDYILAVGSGTLNDLAKYCAKKRAIESGVLATAPSMDGYASMGAALMLNMKKETKSVNMPHDFLIDSTILVHAPRDMIASGFGDIIGKFTCLADWKLASIVKQEPINYKAYQMMENARNDVVSHFQQIMLFQEDGVRYLMDALVMAGLAMAESKNSRPASGSEHHQSHFLEMYFVRQKQLVPLHGIKVALGTLVSLELYHHLKEIRSDFAHRQELLELANTLPKAEEVRSMLLAIDCPVYFHLLSISEEIFKAMIYQSCLVRDRYTILTFYAENGFFDEIYPLLKEKYY